MIASFSAGLIIGGLMGIIVMALVHGSDHDHDH